MSFEIRSDVPVPEVRRGARRTNYPFDVMQVGQSFFVPAGEHPEKTRLRLKSAAARWRKVHGLQHIKFTVAETDDMVGVWRIA